MAIGIPTLLVSGTDALTATTFVLTVPAGGVAAGTDILISATTGSGAVVSSATDSRGGNTWTVDKTAARTTLCSVSIVRCHVSVALQQNDTITLTWSASTGFHLAAAYTVTGLASSAVDQSAAANNSGTAVSVGPTGTTTTANELVFAAEVEYTANDSFVAGSGYTKLTGLVSGVGTASEYKIISATGAQTADGTISPANPWAAAVVTYAAAPAGVAFDAASSSGYEPALSSYSWAHTCTGANRGLIVGVSIFATGTVTAVTYAGTNLSFIRAVTNGVYRTEFWGMPAPATGTNTIAVTLSASLTSIGSAVSYTGVNQTTPFIDSGQATGTGNPASVVVTPATDNDWIVDAIATSDGSITVGAGQTSRANNAGALGSGAMSDKGPITPASAQTMQWTGIGTLDTWAYLAAAVDPFVDATVFSPAQGIVELRGEIIASWAEALGDSGGGGLGLMFGPLARRRG